MSLWLTQRRVGPLRERRVRGDSVVTAKDAYQRSNMPSRWERLTGVAPKIEADRRFLIFVAARYRGEPRLPRPHEVVAPIALHVRTVAIHCGWVAATLVALSFFSEPGLAVTSGTLLAVALTMLMVVSVTTGDAIRLYRAVSAESLAAERRLHSDRLNSDDARTLDEMIRSDEGTLAYCAAKIASEIERDPAWRTDAVGFVEIDLWDELAEVGASSRRIAQDREATEKLKRGRLRDDDEIRSVIDKDLKFRWEATAALAARVNALADYRDHIQRSSAWQSHDGSSLERTTRMAADEQARERLSRRSARIKRLNRSSPVRTAISMLATEKGGE